MQIAPRGCPVCGFPDFEALDHDGYTTFEICPSCGTESGYDYDAEVSDEHLMNLRRHWFFKKAGAWWSSHHAKPMGWDARDQLVQAQLAIPSADSQSSP